MLHAVIMAGGSGTRFWPESRRRRPKQFLQLAGQRTLIQATADRCARFIPPAGLWVVTNQAHAAETGRQLPNVPPEQILCEPCGRNTAPCIGLAAIRLMAVDRDPWMLVLPADHLISTDEQFQNAVEAGCEIVESEPQSLILFGAKPSYPATGFGYIQRGEPIPSCPIPAFRVQSFREKPDRQTAEDYVADGGYYWNCGIFIWRARAILDALYAFAPDLAARLKRLEQSIDKPDWPERLAAEFPPMPSISIDYAVLERSADVCVLEAPFAWDDVGSWQALTRWRDQDAQGNTADGPFCGVKAAGNIVRTTAGHLVAAYGVDDLIIVHTPTATLVANRHDENALRELTAELERQGLREYL
jgi:mannose-1-phosphate guanylyltransferase